MLIELLIRVVDKVNPHSLRLDAMCRKAGDCIAWRASPTTWGIEDVGNPDWRIVLIDVSEAEANALIAHETADLQHPTAILRKNQMAIDLAVLNMELGGILMQSRSSIIDATHIDVMSMAYLKAPLIPPPEVNPNIIGPSKNANVIG